jgi:hypothetical protein
VESYEEAGGSDWKSKKLESRKGKVYTSGVTNEYKETPEKSEK